MVLPGCLFVCLLILLLMCFLFNNIQRAVLGFDTRAQGYIKVGESSLFKNSKNS